MNVACSDRIVAKGNDAGNDGFAASGVATKCDEVESDGKEENSDEAKENFDV